MEEVIISGSAGRIVGKYHQATAINVPIALLLHPHPLHGGTMNNKVVYSMYKTFIKNGFTVLRINFRGVGKSEGKFDNGFGELHDAATALDWLQSQNPSSSSIWVGGFSFGSWIGMQLIMRRPEINEFVAVSPPVEKYDFSFLSPCPIPGIIVQGDNDSVVSEREVLSFVDWIAQQQCVDVAYNVVEGADHFFRNKLDDFSGILDEYLKSTVHKYNSTSSNKNHKDDKGKWENLLQSLD